MTASEPAAMVKASTPNASAFHMPVVCAQIRCRSLIQVNDRPAPARYAGCIMKPHPFFTMVLLGATVAACGGPQPSVQGRATTASSPTAAAPVANYGRAIEIVANDTMKFSTSRFTPRPVSGSVSPW